MALTIPSTMLGTLTWSNNQSAPSLGGITPTAGGIVILMAGFGAGSGVPNVSSVTDTWGDSGGGPGLSTSMLPMAAWSPAALSTPG